MSESLSALLCALPVQQDAKKPRIRDSVVCREWLADLPLAHAPAAQAEISAQLFPLNRHPLAPRERLKVLELLRAAVAAVQGELAAAYGDKPLPLNSAAQTAYDGVCALWQAMAEGYLRCLQGCVDGDAGVTEHAPLIVQRCLRYSGLLLLERYRSRRGVEDALWRRLHALYAYVEEQGFAARPVKDRLNEMAQASSCAAVYAQALLTDLANPYQLSSRWLLLLDRWLDKWGARVSIIRQPPADDSPMPLACDLGSGVGARVLQDGRPLVKPRYLDTHRLAKGLRKRIGFLQKGGDPAQLDIGADCAQPGCEALLTGLYRNWCQSPPGRVHERRAAAQEAAVCFGIPAAHYFVDDERPFERRGREQAVGWKELQELQMFGRVRGHSEKTAPETGGPALERWIIQDEGALGVGLERESGLVSPVALNQLVAWRPADSRQFILGAVRWLVQSLEGPVRLGVEILPGSPAAIAVSRPASSENGHTEYEPALLLPSLPALQIPARLLLPPGWYRTGGTLEIRAGAGRIVALRSLLRRGYDFEQVAFSERDPSPDVS